MNKKSLLIVIFIIFIVSRFLGLGQIYHQDEYRWATIVNPLFADGNSPHPPITQLSLELTGRIFGYAHLRVAPFVFSILCFLLVFLIAYRISQKLPIALTAIALLTINTYSYIANLQIDIDGAVLPFFGLLMFYSYWMVFKEKKSQWLVVLIISIIAGFLTKLSFVLFAGALVADYLWEHRHILSKNLYKILMSLAGLILIAVAVFAFFFSRMSVVISYAGHFKSLNLASRSYFDLVFKLFKSLVWLSPLLALPALAGLLDRKYISKFRFWYLYLFFNAVFYLVLFDFSRLTVERYFMFMIYPAVIISSQWLYDTFSGIRFSKKAIAISILVFVVFLILTVYLNPQVLPLNPKIAYVNKIKNLDFNFLIPMTGGSGPVGFYVSALFVLAAWALGLLGVVADKFKVRYANILVLGFLVFGTGYNIALTKENMRGPMYGSVDSVAEQSLDYISRNPNITQVITYYDIGAYYLRLDGKYYSRFYTAPSRDYTMKLTQYRGQYMIVDFPAIDKNSDYWKLISRCRLDQKFTDKKVESYIFNCANLE